MTQTAARSIVFLLALVMLTACEGERTINLRQSDGTRKPTTLPCIGVDGKHKIPGVDYDWSMRNTIIGALGSELFLIPPVMVLHHEFYCPDADTSSEASHVR